VDKEVEEEKFKAYAKLFNAITDALAIIEKAGFELEKEQKKALVLYCESADKLNIDIY